MSDSRALGGPERLLGHVRWARGFRDVNPCLCLTLTQTKEKYEKSLKELEQGTPQYMENMEQVFDQCQQFEEKRLRFFREVLLEVQKHLDLSNVAG